jgi:hypothetical protein
LRYENRKSKWIVFQVTMIPGKKAVYGNLSRERSEHKSSDYENKHDPNQLTSDLHLSYPYSRARNHPLQRRECYYRYATTGYQIDPFAAFPQHFS